jgi:hypothetical protein
MRATQVMLHRRSQGRPEISHTLRCRPGVQWLVLGLVPPLTPVTMGLVSAPAWMVG